MIIESTGKNNNNIYRRVQASTFGINISDFGITGSVRRAMLLYRTTTSNMSPIA